MRRLLLRATAFVLVFMALQAGWEAARGSWVERLWVHELTVRSATSLINLMTPEVHAVARGARIVAPGGGLNVLFGCEGTDVVFMLAAAFLVFPFPARTRVLGLLSGLVWVFALNQLRIAALFYAFRADRSLFDTLHTMAAPLVMIVLTGLFFHFWLTSAGARDRREAPA
ncbi:MAG: exosortase/archaeosortase family protein [Rhizobacter sp.]